jgi:hypothetical protein
MKYDRVYNFSAGPAMMPVEVLEEIAGEVRFLNLQRQRHERHGDVPPLQGFPGYHRRDGNGFA